jgi:hypothetical protein
MGSFGFLFILFIFPFSFLFFFFFFFSLSMKLFRDGLQMADRKDILEARFLPELAIFFIGADELDSAQVYVGRAINEFLNSWANLHPLMTHARRRALQVSFEQAACFFWHLLLLISSFFFFLVLLIIDAAADCGDEGISRLCAPRQQLC